MWSCWVWVTITIEYEDDGAEDDKAERLYRRIDDEFGGGSPNGLEPWRLHSRSTTRHFIMHAMVVCKGMDERSEQIIKWSACVHKYISSVRRWETGIWSCVASRWYALINTHKRWDRSYLLTMLSHTILSWIVLSIPMTMKATSGVFVPCHKMNT